MERRGKINIPDDLAVSREGLALIRTKMATDRTMLAYVRTTVALAASGVGLLKFWNWQFAHFVGWPLILFSIAVLVIGLREYLKANRAFKILKTLEIKTVEELIK